MIRFFVVLFLFITSTHGEGDIIYPVKYENQKLATRIYCQVQEPLNFRYSSITELWGIMGGQILLEADITLHCMGDDHGGKFENEALKYRVEINNLQLSERKVSDKESMIRHKRGAGEFFSKSWDQIKQFFKRVFRRKSKEPDVTKVVPQQPTDERRETPTAEDPPEDFQISASMYSTPFQFLQFANGSIPEIRFAENEIDSRVKNFKRHLVDAFSTQLNFNQKHNSIVEKSIMGEHTSTYNITVSNPSASLSLAGFTIPQQEEESTVVVKKVVTEGDILTLAPSEALNDREKMELKVEQMQIFQGGRMISSSGFSSLILLPDTEIERNRVRREVDEEEDVTAHLQTHSTFDIQLQLRERRSTEREARLESDETHSYVSASRIAEPEDDSQRRKLRILQEPTIDTAAIFEHLLSGNNINYDEKMQTLFEMVEREVSMKIDKENGSVSTSVRLILSKEVMHEFCSKNFTLCKDFLQLLALAGGPEAENKFKVLGASTPCSLSLANPRDMLRISLDRYAVHDSLRSFIREHITKLVLLSLLSHHQGLSTILSQTVADIMSEIIEPSVNLLHSLGELVQKNSEATDSLGALCLSLGHLASKSSAVEEKESVSRIFKELLQARKQSCHSDTFIIDLLEAVGNLGCEDPIQEVLEVSALCEDNIAVQIACAHALRHSVHLPHVQMWIKNVMADGNCDLMMEVVGSLTDKIREQEMDPDTHSWPRFGFSPIDGLLKDRLLNDTRCPSEDVLVYFGRKRDAEANEVSRNHFGRDSGRAWDGRGARLRRSRVAAWDDLNCREWTEDRFNPIQDSEEFAADRATYNKRKSCLAFRRLGVKGANAEIYAGMFAGVKEPSDPPKYKLFTKFVSALNFLGHEMEIGSFYFYHQSGKTKAYVRILGRTRQEFTNDGCTPTDLSYRPLKHIPLYMVNVGTVQLSLGIHLSSQLAMDTVCPGKEVYQLEPLTNVRIGGEAMGSVLFARGAVNLSGNFNYKLQFTFTPTPDMCLKGSHGYDPMNISFEAYYQLWNVAKDDWGKARTWRPSFLSWDVTNGEMKQWFDDTCIVTQKSEPALNTERERE